MSPLELAGRKNNIEIIDFLLGQKGIKIEHSTFANCKKIKQMTIPCSVQKIGKNSFYNCESLEQVTILSPISKIESHTFEKCINLTEITIPLSVTVIGKRAFCDCKSLIEVKIPSSVVLIDNHAFNGCTNLDRIDFPSSLKVIGDYAFSNCSNLLYYDRLVLPKKLTKIGKYAFYGCCGFNYVEISSTSIDIIDTGTFSNCKSLETVNIDNSVPLLSIGPYAFCECHLLFFIKIPKSAYKIEMCAFDCCSSLTSLEIPFVKIIGNDAFNGCSNLNHLKLYKKVKNDNYSWDFFKGWIGLPLDFQITLQ